MPLAADVIAATRRLSDAADALAFAPPTAFIYNPLAYARTVHEAYLERFAATTKQVLFLGMNPGPFGMAQTGVPFGEIAAVRDWMGLAGPVGRPAAEHPKRPVQGFDCPRSEVSGRRLWGLFQERFGAAEIFFADHVVLNYCPLVFMEEGGKNRTPDKLPAAEREALFGLCDAWLGEVTGLLGPRFLCGIGRFAVDRLRLVFPEAEVVQVLHPSPANPAANRDWAEAATRQLVEAGTWDG